MSDALLRPEPSPVEPPEITTRDVIDAAMALEDGQHLNVGPSATCTIVARQAVMSANRRAGRKVLRSYTHDGRAWVAKVDV